MSLIGIRDMSVLEEAPNERMPIQTYVMEYNDEMVREAITRSWQETDRYIMFIIASMILPMLRDVYKVLFGCECCICAWTDEREGAGRYHV